MSDVREGREKRETDNPLPFADKFVGCLSNGTRLNTNLPPDDVKACLLEATFVYIRNSYVAFVSNCV